MDWQGTRHDDQRLASPAEDEDENEDGDEHVHVQIHEPPRGALLITCGYLLVICALWLMVYLQLISNGGVPRP